MPEAEPAASPLPESEEPDGEVALTGSESGVSSSAAASSSMSSWTLKPKSFKHVVELEFTLLVWLRI